MISKLKHLLEYFKYLSNPTTALKFKFGFIDSCKIKIKNNNHSIELNTIFALNNLMNNLPLVHKEKLDNYLEYIKCIDDNKKHLKIDDLVFINTYNSEFMKKNDNEFYMHLTEFFTDDVLNIIQYSGRHVIDIGGNIGDTALFFAKSGAEVISFEPVPHLHNLAVENVKLNPKLENKIKLINKGVGGGRGKLNLDSSSTKEYIGNDTCEMEVITIEDVLNEYEFTPDILKMDCEGCEFEIIKKCDLSMFNEILFEHHASIVNDSYKPLVEKLKIQGFNIEFYDSEGVNGKFEDQGMIYAYK